MRFGKRMEPGPARARCRLAAATPRAAPVASCARRRGRESGRELPTVHLQRSEVHGDPLCLRGHSPARSARVTTRRGPRLDTPRRAQLRSAFSGWRHCSLGRGSPPSRSWRPEVCATGTSLAALFAFPCLFSLPPFQLSPPSVFPPSFPSGGRSCRLSTWQPGPTAASPAPPAPPCTPSPPSQRPAAWRRTGGTRR